MAARSQTRILRSPLTLALAAALLLPAAAMAQDQATATGQPQQADAAAQKAKTLDKVTVTGSLIPQTEIETFVPVTVISAEDIQARGFSNVAEVLQKTSFATGGVQNNQSSASFTQGAETLSLFGLSSSYVKYLIDGRPMANYPALYNGSDVFNNISGIPVDLVERIEILPGGQSSLYGSDAIAGVVNVILKKNIDGSVLGARVGAYEEGGGKSGRLSLATSVSAADGRWNTIFGLQTETSDPVWSSQRELTEKFNQHAYNGAAPVASRDWMVFDELAGKYVFMDPNNCSNVSDGFGGTVGLQNRPGSGTYCGSMWSPGYRTLKNEKQGAQAYVHSTFDISDIAQLYADVLVNQETVKYHVGSSYTWWGTSVKWGAFYDPNLDTLVNLQRAFTPEDMGGWENLMGENKSTSYSITAGVNGLLSDDSNWDYDISLTRTEYKLTESDLARLADPINDYFQQHVLGEQQGWDPIYGAYPIFTPDYEAFYSLMSPADFNSFMGRTNNRSRTYDNMLRMQLTNGALFALPGGDAGVALALEAGTQGWSYDPDALLLDGKVWGSSAVSGGGQRSRYALTSELRLPMLESLTVSASGRYDGFRAAGREISKPTYALGVEYRPFESLLVRGKYGTAFKAPTLADQFQGVSGFYSDTTDYYTCAQNGFGAENIADCPDGDRIAQFEGEQSGNPDLLPINATVWSYGVVWAPTATFSMSADYHHWDIRNEVSLQNLDQLMRDEANCRLGKLDATSGTCLAALSQVSRLPDGTLDTVSLKKVNVAQETLNAVTVDAHFRQDLGAFGGLTLAGSWTRNLKHDSQQYPTDPIKDALSDPYYSTDAKYKGTASATWNKSHWSTTLYANYLGPTPNYRATLDQSGYAVAGAGRLGSYTTVNGSVNFEVSESLKLSLMVNNIGIRMPEMDMGSYSGTSGAPYNSSNFDVLGRAYYLEAKWSFGQGN